MGRPKGTLAFITLGNTENPILVYVSITFELATPNYNIFDLRQRNFRPGMKNRDLMGV